MIKILYIISLVATLGSSLDTIVTHRKYPAKLVRCYDGDTCTFDLYLGMDLKLSHQKVRLCDINAPEIRPLHTREEGKKSRNQLVNLITTSTSVSVKVPHFGNKPLRDGFGRLLGYVVGDGINYNKVMLDAGAAQPYYRKCP